MLILKKIMAQFFTPLSLTLELFFIGLFLLYFTSKQKTGKTFIGISIIILAICSFTPTADVIIGPLIEQYPRHVEQIGSGPLQSPKVVAVLGAGYNPDMSLPVLSRMGYDCLVRLIEGIRIHRMIPDSKLLLSGGGAPGLDSVAEIMAQVSRDLGVDSSDIILERESLDTSDEARFIHEIVGSEPFILVTSAAHMPRSMDIFTGLGMRPVPAPTKSIEERILYRQPNPFFPSSVNIQKSEMAFHEYLGIIWGKLRSQI